MDSFKTAYLISVLTNIRTLSMFLTFLVSILDVTIIAIIHGWFDDDLGLSEDKIVRLRKYELPLSCFLTFLILVNIFLPNEEVLGLLR